MSISLGFSIVFESDSNIPLTSAIINAAEIPLPDTSAITNPS